MDPYRAECAGILAGFIIISMICAYKEIETGGAKIGCDGASALDMAFKKFWDVRTSDSHFDLIHILIQWHNKIPIQLRKHWIKGHQDKKIPFQRLDRMAQMNVLCDRAASDLGQIVPDHEVPRDLKSDMWRLSLGGTVLAGDSIREFEKVCMTPSYGSFGLRRVKQPRHRIRLSIGMQLSWRRRVPGRGRRSQ